MNRLPETIKVSSIKNSDGEAFNGEKWVPARSLSYPYRFPLSLLQRIKMAYKVFTGKCDALDWEGQA